LGTWYSVFVRSFADSNDDGIGDLKGLILKLDYFQQLGIGGLWLLPVSPSPSYHKYDVTNYENIDPEYGNLADFDNLITEAHQRGIKIIIDLVLNHTSSEFHSFQAAIRSKKNPYRKWYVWQKANTIPEMEKYFWHIPDTGPKDECYYGLFWRGMPDLNYDFKPVQQAAKDIATFWLNRKVDGFRLDAAMHIFPPGRESDNHSWWQEFRQHVEQIKPGTLLIGEVAESCEIIAPYLQNGLSAGFNFDLSEKIIQAVLNENHDCLAQWLHDVRKLYQYMDPDSMDAIFLTNHDQERIASRLNGNADKMKLAASVLLTLPGMPFLYYGEELGMKGMKPDEFIREPFLWNEEAKDNFRTKWLKPEYNAEKDTTPFALQQQDPNSIFNHYARMIAVRNANITLNEGEIGYVLCEDPSILIFTREYHGEILLVFHNLNDEPVVMKNEDEPFHNFHLLFESHPDCEANDHEFKLMPFSSMILKVELNPASGKAYPEYRK
jgi:alpha-amylase